MNDTKIDAFIWAFGAGILFIPIMLLFLLNNFIFAFYLILLIAFCFVMSINSFKKLHT